MVHRFTPTVGGGGLPGYVALLKLYTVIFVTCLNQIVPSLFVCNYANNIRSWKK